MKNIVLIAMLALPLCTYAQDKPLTGDEVRSLVTGKTLEYATQAGVSASHQLEAGGAGTARLVTPRGAVNTSLKWQINDKGELCTHVQRGGFVETCTLLLQAQEGSYSRVKDGKVESSFKVR